ncbi:hypothetical protein TSUD_424790, partial [Trifolium subterraneum]
EDAISYWFSEGVSKKVGNGHMTSFWFDPWLGGTPLRTQFQRLFPVSTQSTSTVREMDMWFEGQWLWDLRWRRYLFVWELNLLESLKEILDRSTISTTNYSWCWKHDPSGCYSVKSTFLALSHSTTDEVIFSVEEQIKVASKSVENLGPFKSGGLFLAASAGQVTDSSKPLASGRHWGCQCFYVCVMWYRA